MSKIDISFSKNELKKLLKLAYIGSYVVSEYEDDLEEKQSEILIERILQICLEYKIEEGIEFDSKLNGYFFDGDKEDEILSEYHEFIEDSFWYEIINRMARKDLVEDVGEKVFEKMDIEEILKKEEKYKIKWEKEIEENGLRNFEVSRKK